MDRFNHLFEKYVGNKATDHEVAEFMKLVRDESNGEPLSKLIDTRLAQNQEETGLNDQERQEVIRRILANRKISTSSKTIWLAAASLVILVSVIGIWQFSEQQASKNTAQEQVVTLSGKNYAHLPDGSTVTLRQGSKITYKESFRTNRVITLTGEAFFVVAHDPSNPFHVQTGKVVTTVLGTAFNIKAPEKVNEITVTVARGKVAVGDGIHTIATITPNQQVAVNTTNFKFTATTVNAESVAPWRNDYFILDRVSIEDAAVLIEKRFNVKVTVANEVLKKCMVSAWFLNNEGLEEVVEGISSVRQAQYTIRKNAVIIEGGIGCGNQ